MTTAEGNLSVTELSFGGLRNNFISYLRQQDYFKDYDFEGSGMSVLLDILAYNTHYQSFYANMVANEMFIDSAVKRSSIVSRAKELGYTPRSFQSASVTLGLTLENYTASSDANQYIPRYTQFTASGSDGRTYTFTNLSRQLLTKSEDNDTTYFCDIVLNEGSVKTVSFIVDNTNPDQKFVIPDVNIDTSSIIVRVQTSVSDNTGFNVPWTLNTDFTTLTSTSKAYFLSENSDGFYEIYFGDGIVGLAPSNSNLITVEYLVTNGPFANGIGYSEFIGESSSQTFTPTIDAITSVRVISPASGGAFNELERSIKYNAPLSYQAQNRAVTENDYKTLILNNFGDIESVSVWGGEENDPPLYGRVFVSVKPNSGTVLSSSQRENIINDILDSKNLVTVTPILVDPDYTYLRVNSNVIYDQSLTGLSNEEIRINVIASIRNFVDTILEKFNTSLNYSKLIKAIDDTNQSITTNYTEIEIEKRFIVNTDLSTYELKFKNELYHPHAGHIAIMSSNGFRYLVDGVARTAYMDDYNGVVRLYYIDAGGQTVYFNENIGSIDYETGLVSLTDFYPITTPAQEIKIRVKPKSPNIFASQGTILTIDRDDSSSTKVTVTKETDTVSRTVNTDFYTSRSNRLSSE